MFANKAEAENASLFVLYQKRKPLASGSLHAEAIPAKTTAPARQTAPSPDKRHPRPPTRRGPPRPNAPADGARTNGIPAPTTPRSAPPERPGGRSADKRQFVRLSLRSSSGPRRFSPRGAVPPYPLAKTRPSRYDGGIGIPTPADSPLPLRFCRALEPPTAARTTRRTFLRNKPSFLTSPPSERRTRSGRAFPVPLYLFCILNSCRFVS